MRNDSLHRMYDFWCIIDEETESVDDAMLLGRPAEDEVVLSTKQTISVQPVEGHILGAIVSRRDEFDLHPTFDPVSEIIHPLSRRKGGEEFLREDVGSLISGEIDVPLGTLALGVIGEDLVLGVKVVWKDASLLADLHERNKSVREDSIDVESEFQIGVKDISHVRSSPVH